MNRHTFRKAAVQARINLGMGADPKDPFWFKPLERVAAEHIQTMRHLYDPMLARCSTLCPDVRSRMALYPLT